MQDSWIHPALYPRKVDGAGTRIFSKKFLKTGTKVARIGGGKIIPEKAAEKLWDSGDDHTQQIDDKFHWAPLNANDLNEHDLTNHSCDPNMWMVGDKVWELRRDVQTHVDQITWDYATSESSQKYREIEKCECGKSNCRKKVTPDDWKNIQLQKRYYGHFAPYLQRKIDEYNAKHHICILNGRAYFIDTCDPPSIFSHELDDENPILADYRSKRQQHIQFFKTKKHGVMLVLDGYPQISEKDGAEYTEALVGPAMLARRPKRVLILGGGDLWALRYILYDPTVEEVVLVDLDRKVVELSKKFFPKIWRAIKNDPRFKAGKIKILHCDALKYLEKNKKKFDLIISDLTDPDEGTASTHLMSAAYFAALRENLEEDGRLVIQGGEKTKHACSGHLKERKLISAYFKYLESYGLYISSFSSIWSFIVASQKPLPTFFDSRIDVLFYEEENRKFVRKLAFLTPYTLPAMFALHPEIEKKIYE